MGQLPSTDGIVWKSSPANLAYWYVKGEHIYVVLNIPAIVTEALKDAEDSQVNFGSYFADYRNGEEHEWS